MCGVGVWAQTCRAPAGLALPGSGADGCLVFHTPGSWTTDPGCPTVTRGSVTQCGGSGPHPYQCSPPCPLAHPAPTSGPSRWLAAEEPSQFGTSGIPCLSQGRGWGDWVVQGVSCFSQCKCVLGGRIAFMCMLAHSKKKMENFTILAKTLFLLTLEQRGV